MTKAVPENIKRAYSVEGADFEKALLALEEANYAMGRIYEYRNQWPCSEWDKRLVTRAKGLQEMAKVARDIIRRNAAQIDEDKC